MYSTRPTFMSGSDFDVPFNFLFSLSPTQSTRKPEPFALNHSGSGSISLPDSSSTRKVRSEIVEPAGTLHGCGMGLSP